MLAMNLAIGSDRVRAEAVEAIEFPDMAIKYQVRGVPRSVINETINIEGAMPESAFVSEVWKHLKVKKR
jgi:predicted DsbA family dithiol-disulfide isomerase